MRNRRNPGVDRKIVEQCRLVESLLEDSRELVLSTKLVPADRREIELYIEKTGKRFPPDYEYWLTRYGSGLIDFVNGGISIPSVKDIVRNEKDGRLWGTRPRDCWNRIYLGYAGAPSAFALDTTIMDRHGCCPVVRTHGWDDQVATVLASSWPMALAHRIIDLVRDAAYRLDIRDNPKIDAIKRMFFPDVDRDLGKAFARAMIHNDTESTDGAAAERTRAGLQEVFTQIAESAAGRKKRKAAGTLKDSVRSAEAEAAQGNCLSAAGSLEYLIFRAKKKDLPMLYRLLCHDLRIVREYSLHAIRKLEKKEVMKEKIAAMKPPIRDLEIR